VLFAHADWLFWLKHGSQQPAEPQNQFSPVNIDLISKIFHLPLDTHPNNDWVIIFFKKLLLSYT